MRMLSSFTDRLPALYAVASVALAIGLTGCASKNPLMEEPVASNPAKATVDKTASNPTATSDVAVAPSRTQRFLGIFSPHKVDIQQGNFVSLEMMAQIKEGMRRPEGVTREQVRFALGTPLLIDIFHGDRWDYVFRLKKGNGELINSHVSLFFKDNRLVRFDGSVLPTEKDYLALIAGVVRESKTSSSEPVPAVAPVTPAAPAK